MNFPFFIARRLSFSGEKNFSSIIIRIAVVAVTLSVGVMIASSALISGFKKEIGQKIFGFWGHLHISDTGYSLSFEPLPISIDQKFYPSLDTFRRVQFTNLVTGEVENSRGGVRHIQVFAHKAGIIRTKTALEGIILKGIGRDFDWENLKPYLMEGHAIAFSDSAASRDIIISRQTADRLQVGVGDKFVVHFVKEGEQLRRAFQVSGIYKTGLEEYDRKFALCDIRTVQELLGWQPDQVAGFEIWLEDLRDLDTYNEFIYSELLPENLLSVSIREKFPAIFEWLELQNLNEVVILGLMLVVAIINMITALLVLVLERTNMIGILKSLGERDFRIQQIFIFNAASITLRGIFWGNLLGIGFCLLQEKFRFIRLNEADYYLSYAPVDLNFWPILAINLLTVLLTLLFLIAPSLVVSRISPLRAIQFK